MIDAVLITILVFAASIFVSILAGPVVEFDSTGSGLIEVNERIAAVDAIVATLLSLGVLRRDLDLAPGLAGSAGAPDAAR